MRRMVNAEGESAIKEMTGNPDIFDMVAAGKDLKLTPELEAQMAESMKALLPSEDAGKFLLEIVFVEDRSMHRPFSGMLMAWMNGGFAGGGGDEKVYFCPNKVERNGQMKVCAAPMPPKLIKHGIGICLSCRQPSEDKKFIGEVFFKLPMQHWVAVVTRYYARLESNCDLKISVMHGDLRKVAAEEQARELRGEKLESTRRMREAVRYPLKSIIRDTGSGATLESAFKAFLTA
jgi:hypothetical protein